MDRLGGDGGGGGHGFVLDRLGGNGGGGGRRRRTRVSPLALTRAPGGNGGRGGAAEQ